MSKTSVPPHADFLSGMEAANMTQNQVAEATGFTLAYINDIVRRGKRPPAATAFVLLNAIDADENVRAFCVRAWFPSFQMWQHCLETRAGLLNKEVRSDEAV